MMKLSILEMLIILLFIAAFFAVAINFVIKPLTALYRSMRQISKEQREESKRGE